MNVGDEVLVEIANPTLMGIAVKYLHYKGLVLWMPRCGSKKHHYLPGDLILCKVLRLSGNSFDAVISYK